MAEHRSHSHGGAPIKQRHYGRKTHEPPPARYDLVGDCGSPHLAAADVFMVVPKRRHITLFANLLRATRNPLEAARALKTGRAAIRAGAMQKLSELAPFLAMIGHPRTIIEVGAGGGGMLRALCAVGADDATIISVDLEGGPYGGGGSDDQLRRRASAREGQVLHLVRGNSRDPAVVERVMQLVPGAVDLLFIDGDHTYHGVSSDYRLYSPLVAPGGMIAFHDILPHSGYQDVRVDRFWAELAGMEKREIASPRELSGVGSTWGGIGVLMASD